jgi:rare lipoprotein A
MRRALPALATLLLATACRPGPAPTRRIPGVFLGRASWYGAERQGRLTASGETYDPLAHTAAHRTLRFGAPVRVTNLRNGRSVVVRINDRGPFASGRVIDLSYAAAQALGMVEAGVVPVRVQVLSW